MQEQTLSCATGAGGSDRFNAGAASDCGIILDSAGNPAMETRGWLHHFTDVFYFIGAVILFLVYGKWMDDYEMPFSLQKTVILTVGAIACLIAGKLLRRNFRYFTVFTPATGEVWRELRYAQHVLRRKKLTVMSDVLAVGVTTRLPVFSMLQLNPEQYGMHEVAIVLLGRNGKIVELSHFSNNKKLRMHAPRRAQFIAGYFKVACRLCRDGEEFRVRTLPGGCFEFAAVNIEKALSQSRFNNFVETIKWPAILVTLIGGWYFLMNLSGVWKK
jgi:hypothetical protein